MAVNPGLSTCSVVGVGASAGGLDALRRLFAALPRDPSFAVIVVQHLDPSTRSRLDEIIGRACDIPVKRARSGDTLRAGIVYVVPEGRESFLEDGRLRLKQRSSACREPIDTLFTSLAEQNQAGGCGVILSGNGSDGTLGLRQIRGAGGLTFAQDPATAEYPSMPNAAIEAGVCDFVGSPEQIAKDLMAHVRHPALGGPPITTRKTKAAAEREAQALAKILGIVRIDSGMDFSAYKPTTITRRVSRRAMLKDAASLDAYLALIEADPAEVAALVDDLLINVTQFFRDPEVFEALRDRVFPEILKATADSDTLRIWVVGCSTGEEVYSILITALEALDSAGETRKVTVFGTDASEASIRKARAGVYPPGICASVSPERLSRFFVRTTSGFEIERSLRDMCVFARQDITKDTPFSRLDLLSLRNVLIYMDQPLQSQVLAVAHFALQPDGVLLLGTSETPETEPRLFRALDKQHHVYRRQGVASRLPVDVANATRASLDALSVAVPSLALAEAVPDPHMAANEMALLLYAPARVVVDADGHILHFFGDTSPFLEHAAGRATLDVTEMAQPSVALELKDALGDAKAGDGRAMRVATLVAEGRTRHVSIEVTRLPSSPQQPQYLVAFREFSPADAAAGLPLANEDLARLYESREQRVRGELGAIRGRLRTISEEKEQANQSLRSANEEIRSSNEELQSINEELETAKEELQSANEELITVNDELRQSNRDLGLANDDLTNFATSIDVPVIVLDRSLRIRRFTPQAQRVVRIEDSDTGRLLAHLRLRVDVADLPRIAADVIETEQPRQMEVKDEGGRWYTLTLRPYLSAEGRVDGAVIAFADVDELKRNAERIERRAQLGEALTRIDADLASTMEIDEIMQHALDEGAEALGADAGAIDRRDGDEWVVEYQHGLSSNEVGLRLTDAEVPTVTAASRAREAVMAADMAAKGAVYVGFVKRHSLRSALAVPLVLRGSLFGCVVFYRRHVPKQFNSAEVDFARRLGASVSLALENARLLHAEQDAARRAETLNAINEIIRTAQTRDELVGRLVGEASEVAGADKSLVIEPHDGGFVVTHVRNVRDDILGVPQAAEQYPAFAAAARERRPVLVADAWNDPLTNKDFVVPYDLRAFQLLPLIVDDSVAAVLALAYGAPQTFDADDEAFAHRVCTAMTVALKNAMLLESEVRAQEEAKRELQTTALLLDVAGALVGPGELDAKLKSVAEKVAAGLDHSRVVVDVWDESERAIRIAATVGGAAPAKRLFPWDDLSAAAREALTSQKSVPIDYTHERASVREVTDALAFWLALAVPMVTAGKTVGLFLVDQPGEARPFSAREVDLLESIANQTAVAIENARLFEAEVAAQQSATRELNTANTLLEAANELNRWTDLPSLLDALVGILLRLIPGGRVNIGIPAEDRSSMTMAAGGGQRPYPIGAVVPWDRLTSGSRAALETGLTSIIDFEAAEEGGIANEYGSRLALFVALKFGDRIVGQVGLDVPGERYDFTPRMIALIEGVAFQAAVAIENARLFAAEGDARERATRELDLTDALLGASKSLVAATDLEQVMGVIVDAVVGSTRHSRVTVTLWSQEGVELEVVASRGEGAIEPGRKFGLDAISAPSREVLASGKTATFDIEGLGAGQRGTGDEVDARIGLIAPLAYQGRVLGLLGVDEPSKRLEFDEREIALIEGLAAQAAVATERARLFEVEKVELARTTILREVAAAAAGTIDTRELSENVLAACRERLGARAGTVYVFDRDAGDLEATALLGFPKKQRAAMQRMELDEARAASRSFIKNEIVRHDAHGLPEGIAERAKAVRAMTDRWVVVPIRARRELVGSFGLIFPGQRAFSADELALYQALADQMGVGLENARLFQSEVAAQRQATLELETTSQLLAAARSLAGWTDLGDVLDQLAKSVHAATGRRRVFVHRWDEEHPALVLTASAGEGGAPLGSRYEWDKIAAPSKQALTEKRPRIIDYDEIAALEDKPYAGTMGFRLALAVPLVERSTLLGLVIVDDPGERNEFSPREIQLVEGIAAQASAAVRTARLFEAEQTRTQRLTVLKEIGEVAASSLEIGTVSRSTVDSVLDLLGARQVQIRLLSDDGASLVSAASAGLPEGFLERLGPIATDSPIETARCFRAGTTCFDEDVLALDVSDASRKHADDSGVRAHILVPLKVGDAAFGTLYVAWGEPRRFAPEDVSFVEEVATRVAVSLKNVMLFAAEQSTRRRVEALQKIVEFATSSLELVDVIDRAAAYLAENLDIDVITYWRLDEARRLLFPVTGVGFPIEFYNGFSAGVGLDQPFEIAHAVVEKRPVVRSAGEIALVPEPVRASYAKFGVRLGALLVLPVRAGSRTMGAITFAWQEPREITASDVEFFASAVDEIAIGAENAALFAEVRDSARLDEALNAIDVSIHSTLDFEGIMKSALKEGAAALGCDAGTIEMREGAGWRVRFQHGFSHKAIGRFMSDAEAPNATRAERARAPFVVPDTTKDAITNVGFVAEYKVCAALAVPLVVRDHVTGCLLFYERKRSRSFTPVEIDFAVKLAASVSLATENAELFESEQRELARTRLLQSVATAVSSSLSPTEICEKALEEVRSLPDAAGAAVYALDDQRTTLTTLAIFGYPDDLRAALANIPVDDTTNPGRVVLHDLASLTHEDPGNPPQATARLAAMGVPSARWVVLPLKSAGRLVGAIGLIFHGERSFEPQEITLFSGIADTLAASLANARLYEAELKAQRQIQLELETTGLLLETANTLSTWEDVDSALTRLGAILLASTDQGRVTLNLWDEGRQELRTVVSVGKAAMAPAAFPYEILSPQIKKVISKKKTFVFDYDADASGHTAQLAAERVIHLGLVIPIVYQQSLLGLIGVDSPGERREFEIREIARLEAVASQAAVAIMNARLLEAQHAELARTNLLREIAAIGASALSAEDMAQRALETLRAQLGATTGNIFMIDAQRERLRSLANVGVPEKAQALYQEVRLDADTASSRVALTGEVATHDGADTPDATSRVAAVTGSAQSGWIIVPMRVRGAVIGTIGLSFARHRAFGADEVALLQGIADQLGVGLQRVSLFEDLQEAQHRVSTILESISDGFYALDREWRFTYANAEAGRMIGAQHDELIGRTIGEVLDDPGVQNFQEAAFAPAMHDGEVVAFERFFPQTEIWADIRAYPSEEGISVYGRDITQRRVVEEALRQTRERSEIMAALLDDSAQPFGVGNLDGSLGLVNRAFEQLTGYTADELTQVSWVTKLTPPEYAKLESAKLEELVSTGDPVRYEKEYVRKDGTRVPIELLVHLATDEAGAPSAYYSFITDLTERKERERFDTAFNEIRTAVGSTLELADIVETALTSGATALGSDSAELFMRTTDGWSLAGSFGKSGSAEGEASTYPGFGVPRIVADDQGPINIDDAALDARLNRAAVRREGVKSILAMPLGVEGAELGVLLFYDRKKRQAFSGVPQEFVARLARVVTLAIQNSMLYERERTIAETLQDALLTPLGDIEGVETSYVYRAASNTANVGGDFCDVFTMGEHECGILVGDVSGKGIQAARLTSLMRDGIRAYALETNDPREILGRLNRLVSLLTPVEQYATLFFGVLDTESGLLRYSTAGHPSPAIVSAAGASYLIGTRAPILGAFPGVRFECHQSVLARGERLVAYTDGVTEARRGTELLGEEGLLAMLDKLARTPVSKLPERLLDRVLEYAEGQLRDDTVILSLSLTRGVAHQPKAKSKAKREPKARP